MGSSHRIQKTAINDGNTTKSKSQKRREKTARKLQRVFEQQQEGPTNAELAAQQYHRVVSELVNNTELDLNQRHYLGEAQRLLLATSQPRVINVPNYPDEVDMFFVTWADRNLEAPASNQEAPGDALDGPGGASGSNPNATGAAGTVFGVAEGSNTEGQRPEPIRRESFEPEGQIDKDMPMPPTGDA